MKRLTRAIDRKLIRDLWRMRGQAMAIALVTACGIASFITMRSGYETLSAAQARYYEQYRFADVFATVRRAPLALVESVRAIPGVNQVTGRVVFDASLDVPGLDEPASGRIVSLPDRPGALNQVHLRTGRLPEPGSAREVLVSEAFATANGLHPGDRIGAVINGRKEELLITGIGISPEYVNEIKGNSFPDNRRFGVIWMELDAAAAALDMRDGFNDLALTLAPHGSEAQVIERLDNLLSPYGTLGAYGRRDQVSHSFLVTELKQTRVSSTVIPAVFLSVVAFLIHNALLRTVSLQRAQIALLKSFGYGSAEVGWHYLKSSLLTVLAGCVLGIGLGAWMGRGLAYLYTRFYHFPSFDFAVSPASIALAFAIAAIAGAAGASLAVRRVLVMAPAEAMRPEAPPRFKPGPLERIGMQAWMALPLRMVLRNLERAAPKSMLSIFGLSLAVALMVTGQYTFDALDEIIRVQFRTAQRDDISVNFNEARQISVSHELAALPGVTRVEPFRSAAVRMRHEHHSKKTVLLGLGTGPELRRVVDERMRTVEIPDEGLVLNKKLAQLLATAAGDYVTVEFLEGRRRVVRVPVIKVIDEPIGISGYMNIHALARAAGESASVSGAFLAVDPSRQQQLYRDLKEIPAISSVNLREATLRSFLDTIGENMRINTSVLLAFACVIAFGVVYNGARVALSEHAVELASLRILGFTKAEVAGVLLGEQALLTLAAIPAGCLLGYGLAALLSALLSQELYRIPLVVSTRTYALAGGTVVAAALFSAYLIWRKIQRLDLIEVLKTRE